MESAVVQHFMKAREVGNSTNPILSCKHVTKGTGLKSRQVFALLNKSPKFERLGGLSVGYRGARYSFYRLNDC
tara:strand:- start:632 stop:850 length:219 start_codon:yes stop_codon:yes gene_type:complete